MPATGFAVIGSRTVTVRELTVREVRDWLTAQEVRQGADVVGVLALDECSLDDLAHMSDISAEELDAYAPSDLADLVSLCKALNPHFFKVRAALSGVARVVLTEAQALASTATAVAS